MTINRNGRWDCKVLKEQPPLDGTMQLAAMKRIASIGLPWRVRDQKTGIVMLLCAPDSLVIGSALSERGHQPDEKLLAVTIPAPYYLAECAVTQEAWARIMGSDPSVSPAPGHPVNNVSAWECLEFAKRCGPGFRLPHEAEWENACRAGSTTPFSHAAILDALQMNCKVRRNERTPEVGVSRDAAVPVGSMPPNRWGFHEMHGNVWEWCSAASLRTARLGDRRIPTVLRGGSWGNYSHSCRSASRLARIPEYRRKTAGFRLARDVTPPP
jgi:formylglycine-generating enzyme required for sulfatase activity